MIAILVMVYTGIVLVLFKLKLVKPRPFPIACVVLAGILLIGGVVVAWTLGAPLSSRVVTTQYVVQLVPYVKGQVLKVHAKANQPVKKGALLLEIKPDPYQYTVNQVKAQLDAAKENVEQARAGVKAAEANVAKSEAGIAQARAAIEQAQANVANARAAVKKATAQDDLAKTEQKIALNLQKVDPGAISDLKVAKAVQNRQAMDAGLKQAEAAADEAAAGLRQANAGLGGSAGPGLFSGTDSEGEQRGPLTSNRNFSNFIGFLSNPLQSIDPRSLTQICPLFLSSWVSPIPALPSGDGQVYGPAISLALSDRLCVGMNQGGYARLDFNGNEPGLFRDRFGKLHDRRELAGDREGWLNLGGFVQYTLIEDVPNQFLLTAGMRIEVPSGSSAIFQGNGPAHLAPYATVGKELGCFHVLATGGYQFPTGSGDATTDLFYLNLHLDRQILGWLYPLVELNCIYHTTSVAVDLPTRRGLIDFGNFESSGNLVTLGVGANAVIVRNRLEFGAVYTTSLATQRGLDLDGLLVKMVMRY